MMRTYILADRRNEFGEYVIRCYRDYKRYEAGDYFTTERDDAIATLAVLIQAERQSNRHFSNNL